MNGDSNRGFAAVAAPTLTVLAGSAVALAGTLAVRAVMARSLAPDGFGLLVTAIALATVTGGIANFGINPAAALRVGEGLGGDVDSGLAGRAARTALVFGVSSGIVAAAFVYLAAPAMAGWFAVGDDRARLAATLRTLVPVPLLMPIGGAALGIYRAHGRAAARALIRDGGGGIARAIGVGIAAVLGGGIATLGVGYSAGVVLAEGGFVLEVLRRGWLAGARTARFDGELLRRLPPFGLLEVLNQGRMWIDLLAVSLLASPAVVGIYGLARGLARGLEVVFHAGIHRYLPAIGGAPPAQRPALADDTRRFVLAVLLVPVAVGLAAPTVPVWVLAGRPYLESAPVLAWLSLAILIEAVFGYQDQSLLALGRSRLVASIDTLGLLAYGGLLTAWVPRFGAIGAAWALVAIALGRSLAAACALSLIARRDPDPDASLAGWPTSIRVLGASSLLGLAVLATRRLDTGMILDLLLAIAFGGLGVLTLYHGRTPPRPETGRP